MGFFLKEGRNRESQPLRSSWMGALANQLLTSTLFPNPQTPQAGHEFSGSHNITVILCWQVWDQLVPQISHVTPISSSAQVHFTSICSWVKPLWKKSLLRARSVVSSFCFMPLLHWIILFPKIDLTFSGLQAIVHTCFFLHLDVFLGQTITLPCPCYTLHPSPLCVCLPH